MLFPGRQEKVHIFRLSPLRDGWEGPCKGTPEAAGANSGALDSPVAGPAQPGPETARNRLERG